jgi:hypothetical protein
MTGFKSKRMDIVTKLEDAYAFLGDPLHREAANEIERLREELRELASTTYHSVNDYKERASEALRGK